jgi:hypothetical protein
MEGQGDKHEKIIAILIFCLVGVFILLIAFGGKEYLPKIIPFVISAALGFAATAIIITLMRLFEDVPDEKKRLRKSKFWFEKWPFKIIVFVAATIIFRILIMLSF